MKRRDSQSKLQVQKERAETRATKRKRNAPWSQQVANKEQKEKRRLKRDRKREWLKSHASASSVQIPVVSQLAEDSVDEDDWDELAEEERLAKKVRKGAVTQQAFDAEFGDL